jgi:ABC-type dipeptide/oligopeptide/nickel transport system ATPase component
VLQAVHLVKRFSGITVVNDVSFEVRPAEVVGYLGPNGSGKTTTTRMLTGLPDPTSGDVHFEGQSIRANPLGFRQRLGYVPEEQATRGAVRPVRDTLLARGRGTGACGAGLQPCYSRLNDGDRIPARLRRADGVERISRIGPCAADTFCRAEALPHLLLRCRAEALPHMLLSRQLQHSSARKIRS